MHALRTWLGLTLLVGLPIIVLVVYALSGLRSERRALMADAYDEGQRLAEFFGAKVESALEVALVEQEPLKLYEVTPQPQTEHPDEKRLREGDLQTLRALCDSIEQTSAGLPIASLAAWQVYQQEDTSESLDRLYQIAIHEMPSTLSPVLLERAGVPNWRPRWEAMEARRSLLRLGDDGPVKVSDRLAGWVEDGRVATRSELEQFAKDAMPIGIPSWLDLQVRHGTDVLWPDTQTPDDARVLANSNGRLETQALLVDEANLLAPYHRQRRWTLSLIALAMLASGAGLVLTQKALHRERHLSHMKSQFVASVSHELRAPVASIRLMAEALESGKVVDAKKAKSFHRLMAGESARLASMVENVLDFARIEQDRKGYDFAETDVEALAEDAVALLRPQAETKGITLRTTFEKLAFSPTVDSLAIQQALVNLLDNALKFSPKESTVVVTLRALPEKEGAWCLSVSDEGPGIAPEDHARVFERFTRLENELRRETQGAGIGLSLVQHVVEAHGGDVVLESKLGEGSTFTLNFPPSVSHG